MTSFQGLEKCVVKFSIKPVLFNNCGCIFKNFKNGLIFNAMEVCVWNCLAWFISIWKKNQVYVFEGTCSFYRHSRVEWHNPQLKLGELGDSGAPWAVKIHQNPGKHRQSEGILGLTLAMGWLPGFWWIWAAQSARESPGSPSLRCGWCHSSANGNCKSSQTRPRDFCPNWDESCGKFSDAYLHGVGDESILQLFEVPTQLFKRIDLIGKFTTHFSRLLNDVLSKLDEYNNNCRFYSIFLG